MSWEIQKFGKTCAIGDTEEKAWLAFFMKGDDEKPDALFWAFVETAKDIGYVAREIGNEDEVMQ